jgi:hemoglobin-like flavoprotein
MNKRANLWICGKEEWNKIQTKGMKHIFKDIRAENFPNVEKEMHTQIHEVLRSTNIHSQIRTLWLHTAVKMPKDQSKEY